MKVLVTGAAGHIGRATTERLIQHGWDIRAIGLEAEAEIPGAEFATCDILNYDDLRQQMRGCQAVIHLAAISGPQLARGTRVFEVNCAGTFNVFEAAAAEGIRRVVQASSINALGCAFSLTDISPRYFPIDEAHPSFTTDPYSFSKEVTEDIGRYYWRRDAISSVALRFPWVYPGGYIQSEDFRQRRQLTRQGLDELAALADADRQARLADVRQRALEYRARRLMEFREDEPKSSIRRSTENQLWYAYTFDRFNLWAFVDERDAAQALEKGLNARYDGAHTLFITDSHNWSGYDSRSLVRFFFPEVSESAITLSGSEALLSIDQARELIGFEPEYSVENWADRQAESG
jgi:nucleoside-diphosphate-sugar epimerase